MTINNNKHIITSEILWARQILSTHATFITLSKVSVVFSISSLHSNANLPISRFS